MALVVRARSTSSATSASAASASLLADGDRGRAPASRPGSRSSATSSGAARPTAFDRVLATRFGVAAIDAVHDGAFGQMVALQAGEIVRVPLADAVGELKLVDPDALPRRRRGLLPLTGRPGLRRLGRASLVVAAGDDGAVTGVEGRARCRGSPSMRKRTFSAAVR